MCCVLLYSQLIMQMPGTQKALSTHLLSEWLIERASSRRIYIFGRVASQHPDQVTANGKKKQLPLHLFFFLFAIVPMLNVCTV